MTPSAAAASPSSLISLMTWLSQRIQTVAPACLFDGLTSVTLPLPEGLKVALPSGLASAWSWQRRSDDISLVGYGHGLVREFAGMDDLAAAVKALAWHHLDPDGVGAEPLAFLGHAFGANDAMGLPAALLTVPEVLVRRVRGRCSLVLSHAGQTSAAALENRWTDAASRALKALDAQPVGLPPVEPLRVAEMPATPDFLAKVEAARDAVAKGRLDKVVLSRQVQVKGSRPFDPARLAAALAGRYPGCAVLSASFGDRVLVAASPERLVARRGERIESLALAGTAPNFRETPFPDRRLLASDKDRIEHRPVVRHIAAVLAELCQDKVEVPQAPVVMELNGLQHLATPISGRLKAGVGLLDAARALHPTPAIAGWPRATALQMIEDLGETRGGWYSGAMGWMDRAGDGELAVVLRCVVLEGMGATLAAGGGIVAASDPMAELAETELKLAAILESLKVA